MQATQSTESDGKARYGLDPYEDWIAREGLPVAEGLALDLFKVETADWPRIGAKGAITKFRGAGDFCSMFVVEIPAGGSTIPQHHLYEEIYFVLDGRGSTQFESADGKKRAFEWGRGSFFGIPLNATYRHFNASGSQRALLATTTTLPLMIKVIHNEEFIFNTPFWFGDRTGKDEYYQGVGDLHLIRAGQNIWETNFVPNLLEIDLPEWEDRGKGSGNINFSLADGIMHAHISEIAPATYKKAHRHDSGAHVMTLSGGGYSLLWDDGETEFQRVDWTFGTVFPPADMQWHQHFVTTNEPSRYVATAFGGIRYPTLDRRRQLVIGKPGEKQMLSRSVKEGGTQLEYEDQDPRIHALWLEEMRKAGITPRLELPVRK
jgi:mannose-6-phosphate isomerase-like protein (cupin superfamily)